MTPGTRKLPNFFVVGAMKAGTGSLYDYLRAHPQIYMSRIKEPGYFSTDIRPPLDSHQRRLLAMPSDTLLGYVRVYDFDYYCRLFEGVGAELAVGECSVSYLPSRTAATEIRSAVPHARIIIVLRNPVERAYSHYLMNVRNEKAPLSFRNELNRDRSKIEETQLPKPYVQLGLYSEQVERYLNTFPSERVKIFLYEDIRDDFSKFIANVYDFLGVDGGFRPPKMKIRNQSRLPRSKLLNLLWVRTPLRDIVPRYLPEGMLAMAGRLHYSAKVPELSSADREYLLEAFAPDIKKLERLINRELKSWLH
ncbi:MAG TPA: sulfotransferase [Candidatus Binataceae bacterium]